MSRQLCNYDQELLCVNNYRGEDYGKPETCVDCEECINNPDNQGMKVNPNDTDKVIFEDKDFNLIKEMRKFDEEFNSQMQNLEASEVGVKARKQEDIQTFTAYDIIHKGLSICPELNRDEYFEQRFIKFEDSQLVNQDVIEKSVSGHEKGFASAELVDVSLRCQNPQECSDGATTTSLGIKNPIDVLSSIPADYNNQQTNPKQEVMPPENGKGFSFRNRDKIVDNPQDCSSACTSLAKEDSTDKVLPADIIQSGYSNCVNCQKQTQTIILIKQPHGNKVYACAMCGENKELLNKLEKKRAYWEQKCKKAEAKFRILQEENEKIFNGMLDINKESVLSKFKDSFDSFHEK